MFVNEVCKKCALTKKAVEYYIEQGLIMPTVKENGYRDFSDTNAVQLKKISVLRGLGVSVADIRKVLSGENASLHAISEQKLLEISLLQEKQRLMQELVKTQDWERVQDKLQQLQRKQSVLERLRNAFPGYYGNCICQHFAPYLGELVQTEEQQEAFDTIVAFLDNVHLEIPDDLQKYYDELTVDFDDGKMDQISASVRSALCDMDRFFSENSEIIENYMRYKQAPEYKTTQIYRLEEVLKQFNQTSGYNEVFIPAMCRLSAAYREYYETLQQANEQFLHRYPGWREKNE